MANRQTVKSNIISKIVPKVSNAIHIDVLNAEMADNLVFREDVAVVQTSTVSSITCDFTGKDRIDLTRTGGSLAITLSGIGDGETKYLLITKTAGQAVTFVGTTDITPVKQNANAVSIVVYQIIRKGSYYFAWAWVENVKTATDVIEGVLETATAAECNALSAIDKIVTPGRIPRATASQSGISEWASSTEVDSGSTSRVALAYDVKRKYDAAIAYAAGLNTTLAARVSTLEGRPQIIAQGKEDIGDITTTTFGAVIAFGTHAPVNTAAQIYFSLYDANGLGWNFIANLQYQDAYSFHLRFRELSGGVNDVTVYWHAIL